MFNPFKRRKRHHRNKKRSHRYNPVRHHRVRHHRRNPISSVGHLLPMVASGAIGAVAVRLIPSFLGMTSGLMMYGVQLAVIAGGGWAAEKAFDRSAGDGWIIGSASSALQGVVTSLLNTFGISTPMAGFGDPNRYQIAAFPEMSGYDAFPPMSGFGASYHDTEMAPSSYASYPG